MLTLFDHLTLWGAFFLAGFVLGFFIVWTLAEASSTKVR